MRTFSNCKLALCLCGLGSITELASAQEYYEPTVTKPQQAVDWSQANYYTQPVAAQKAAKQTARSQSTTRKAAVAQPNYYMQQSTAQTSNYYTQPETTQAFSQQQHAYAQQQQAYSGYQTQTVSNSPAGKGLLSRLTGRSSRQAKAPAASGNVYRTSSLSGQGQTGVASWYGGKWHGRKTANGERYNMDSMTAAHKTLPFGTVVKVTNLNNGSECTVRINNRGPFTKGRVLDLSRAAARQLGFMGRGITKVKMEVVGRS